MVGREGRQEDMRDISYERKKRARKSDRYLERERRKLESAGNKTDIA
jgi:hypothetical protein